MKHHKSDYCTAIMVLRVPLIKITKVRQMCSSLYLHSIYFDISALLSNNLFEWPACILQLISVKYFPLCFKVNYANWKELNPCCDSARLGRYWLKQGCLNKQMLDSSLPFWLWHRISLGKTKQSIWTLQGNISRCISLMALLCNEILIAKCIIDDIVRGWEHVCMRVSGHVNMCEWIYI